MDCKRYSIKMFCTVKQSPFEVKKMPVPEALRWKNSFSARFMSAKSLYESPEFLSFLRREMSKYAHTHTPRERKAEIWLGWELSLFTPGAEGGSEGHAENRNNTHGALD